ncbi:mannose-1-phosphate guanylyltransferase/mannose-6-phosphate isomerase [Methylobacillus sp.]|uniref:mannose-1-phosphate guanylyltransferase/mannose-6-phosphate isomerase n=1 Tax=Methylobacillus sp. TaxID=56818 RepID=UPI0012C9D5AA|nr:mannose-1-phosphate guanylyltransferase/mannose-6-phosphate isomerase [Methylobacillus sp.]MPS47923.1 mannose-1-phosphate guanylyltransferase/mannose-6-phosphate isomerase [Methylobacillus sp.]
MIDRYAVMLCGGSGTRLWPLSRALRPKQLLALNGKQTLLQQTALRLARHVPAKHLVTVTHDDHKFEVKGQLAEVLPEAVNGVMAEPYARNTLPAIAWAVSRIHLQSPNAVVGVFPSDHSIDNEDAFHRAWLAAEKGADLGYLTLLGVSPTEPATGYGYIQPADARIGQENGHAIYEVARFVEKPDRADAEAFLTQGYLWNSGMFVFRADVFMQLLTEHQPEIAESINKLDSSNIPEEYSKLPNISMDYGLAEKARQVAVVPVDMAWSDLGSWDSIYQRNDKNRDNNVCQGDVLALDTQDSLLWNTHGLLATLGVSNLAIIQTADATLICDRGRTEDIKQLVTLVQEQKPELAELHRTVQRPWGHYAVLEEGVNFKIKRISVNPGASLSMQMHHHRSEHWVVVSGVARITNGDQEITLKENESTYIPKTHRHRLSNPGDVPLHIIEVQCGEYVGEDDIVRFEDKYGRN